MRLHTSTRATVKQSHMNNWIINFDEFTIYVHIRIYYKWIRPNEILILTILTILYILVVPRPPIPEPQPRRQRTTASTIAAPQNFRFLFSSQRGILQLWKMQRANFLDGLIIRIALVISNGRLSWRGDFKSQNFASVLILIINLLSSFCFG